MIILTTDNIQKALIYGNTKFFLNLSACHEGKLELVFDRFFD